MSRLKDLIGQKFGMLTVVQRAENRQLQTCWLCICDCGNTKSVQASHLKNGNTRSCGCLLTSPTKFEDIAGQKFGMLTAFRRDKYSRAGTYWICKCECGNTKSAMITRLKNGNTKSCGCLAKIQFEAARNKSTPQDITGQKFGMLTAVTIDERRKAGTYWICKCECGTTKSVIISHLKLGRIASCGCLRAKRLAELRITRTEKKCTRCKEFRPLPEFGVSRGRWDGLNPNCKRCQSVLSAVNEHRRRNAPGKFTADDITRLYEQQQGECVYCSVGLSSGYHIDHIIPIAKGGTNYPDNIQLLCPKCNLKKNAKMPDVFLAELLEHGVRLSA
jgi:5-methylcytosine-specific restriction endonuclease McrA